MSTAMKVCERVGRIRKGVPFSIDGFYALGTRMAVQKAMSRMVKKGKIVRVCKGIYVRPKTLASVPSITVTASPEQIAKKWAQRRGFKLVSQGLEAAYKLGFQTQAPVKTVFWSNGPTREFKIGYASVLIRHVSDKKLQWAGKPEGMLLRAMSVTNPEHIEAGTIKAALKRLSLTKGEAKSIINKLKKTYLPAGWQDRLAKTDEMIS